MLLKLHGGAGNDDDDRVESVEASHVRRGTVVLLKEKPCKVVDNAVSKVGKHGAAKCHITGVDIFTGKKVEEICPGHTAMQIPTVTKTEYSVIDLAEDGEITVMDEDNNLRDDLKMPEGYELAKKIQNLYKSGDKEVTLVVMKCRGREVIVDAKADTA